MNVIVVDTMGGDYGPYPIVKGVESAIIKIKRIDRIILIGDCNLIECCFSKQMKNSPLYSKIKIIHSSEVINMNDNPFFGIRKKKRSSMMIGLDLLKNDQKKFFISAGNTGSLVIGSIIKLKLLKGILRPALATIWPKQSGNFIFIDSGANLESNYKTLVQNSILGSQYANYIGIKTPKIGLLTVGIEEEKGTYIIKKTHNILKLADKKNIIKYDGLIEGFQLFRNNPVEVVVCDGFVGNILLKTSESLFKMLIKLIKKELKKNIIRKIGSFLCKSAFKNIKKKIHPDKYGGALLLGVNGKVMKVHGSSNSNAILNSIILALKIIDKQKKDILLENIQSINKIL
jgi:glycerol-3-phosphate acyltransferase PlsX